MPISGNIDSLAKRKAGSEIFRDWCAFLEEASFADVLNDPDPIKNAAKHKNANWGRALARHAIVPFDPRYEYPVKGIIESIHFAEYGPLLSACYWDAFNFIQNLKLAGDIDNKPVEWEFMRFSVIPEYCTLNWREHDIDEPYNLDMWGRPIRRPKTAQPTPKELEAMSKKDFNKYCEEQKSEFIERYKLTGASSAWRGDDMPELPKLTEQDEAAILNYHRRKAQLAEEYDHAKAVYPIKQAFWSFAIDWWNKRPDQSKKSKSERKGIEQHETMQPKSKAKYVIVQQGKNGAYIWRNSEPRKRFLAL